MAWQAKPKGPENGPKRYFAYSVSLDPEFRAGWRSSSGAALPKLAGDVGELKGFELVYRSFHPRWGGRIAGLEAGPGRVFGRVFEVPAGQWGLIEELERTLNARPVEVQVLVGGKAVTATAFVPAVAQGGADATVSEAFVATLVRGVAQAGLPAAYVGQLESEALILEAVQKFGREQLGLGVKS